MTIQEVFERDGYITFGSAVEVALDNVWPPGHCNVGREPSTVSVRIIAVGTAKEWASQALDLGISEAEIQYQLPWFRYYYRAIAE